MRTIVDIPEDMVKALDLLGKRQDLPRAELVRRAVADYLEREKGKSQDAIDKYYGFLAGEPEAFEGLDGLEYQRKMRAEWDSRDEKYRNWGLQDSAKTGYDDNKSGKKKS